MYESFERKFQMGLPNAVFRPRKVSDKTECHLGHGNNFNAVTNFLLFVTIILTKSLVFFPA